MDKKIRNWEKKNIRQMFLRVDSMWRSEKRNDSIYNTHSLCCVCVNVDSPGNGESSLSFLHLYQCNSIIQSTSNHSHIQSKMNFLLKAVLYSNPRLISYHILIFNIIYTWQIVLLACAYLCTLRIYTQTYTVSE